MKAPMWVQGRMRNIVTVVVAFLLLAVSTPAAWAHAVLVSSSPRANATVAASGAEVVLKYNSRIDVARSSLKLAGPGGAVKPLAIAPQKTPDELRATLQALKPGAYLLRWQVLASDGHITRGEIPFRVE